MKPRRAGDAPVLVAGNARLVEALAWTPRFNDIETIVRDALEWERKLEAIQASA
jgi:UDP-glucose 4-epimerase